MMCSRNKLFCVLRTALTVVSCMPTILPDEEVPVQQYANVMFDKNAPDATGSMDAQSIPKGFARRLKACAFTRTKYRFAGWSRTATGAVEYPDTASFSSGNANVTLYAQWVIAERTINGSSIYLPVNAYSRLGYEFAGWPLSAEGPIQYTNQAKFQFVDANVTLYAQWTFKTYNVGDRGTANGYIFYINPNYATDGWRYLEAAAWDANSSKWEDYIIYGGTATDIQQANKTSLGFGYSNTLAIFQQAVYANIARVRVVFQFSYSNNGFLFGDWFVPSYEELVRMYSTIRSLPGSGFSATQYWSSTQASQTQAYYINFNDGTTGAAAKNTSYRIRPVRRF